ncbi:hypothetical protein V6N13_034140 [Hibiscus sabdariffa]
MEPLRKQRNPELIMDPNILLSASISYDEMGKYERYTRMITSLIPLTKSLAQQKRDRHTKSLGALEINLFVSSCVREKPPKEYLLLIKELTVSLLTLPPVFGLGICSSSSGLEGVVLEMVLPASALPFLLVEWSSLVPAPAVELGRTEYGAPLTVVDSGSGEVSLMWRLGLGREEGGSSRELKTKEFDENWAGGGDNGVLGAKPKGESGVDCLLTGMATGVVVGPGVEVWLGTGNSCGVAAGGEWAVAGAYGPASSGKLQASGQGCCQLLSHDLTDIETVAGHDDMDQHQPSSVDCLIMGEEILDCLVIFIFQSSNQGINAGVIVWQAQDIIDCGCVSCYSSASDSGIIFTGHVVGIEF